MKTIIAGGRDYLLTKDDFAWLATLPITEVVSGGARGADAGGEEYAKYAGLPLTRFIADWQVHGKLAGFIRNMQMAKYAEACVLFPGGSGTAHMRQQAISHGLVVYERQAKQTTN